jgi:hypothetical protein
MTTRFFRSSCRVSAYWRSSNERSSVGHWEYPTFVVLRRSWIEPNNSAEEIHMRLLQLEDLARNAPACDVCEVGTPLTASASRSLSNFFASDYFALSELSLIGFPSL